MKSVQQIDIYRHFEMMFPEIAMLVAEWEDYGYLEVRLTLDDGSQFVYDRTSATLRPIEYSENGELTQTVFCREFGIRLRNAMLSLGIGQEELACITGINQSTLSRYINGKTLPDILKIRKIAKVLGCDISYLTEFGTTH